MKINGQNGLASLVYTSPFLVILPPHNPNLQITCPIHSLGESWTLRTFLNDSYLYFWNVGTPFRWIPNGPKALRYLATYATFHNSHRIPHPTEPQPLTTFYYIGPAFLPVRSNRSTSDPSTTPFFKSYSRSRDHRLELAREHLYFILANIQCITRLYGYESS